MEKCAIRPLMSADFQNLIRLPKPSLPSLGGFERRKDKNRGDLHDQIGQNLVLAKMKLDALKSSLGNKHMALVAGISDLINHTIQDTRSLIHELHPEWLSQLSFKEAVDWLAEQTEAKYGLPCTVGFAPLSKPLKRMFKKSSSSRPGAASERGQACGCKRGENSL